MDALDIISLDSAKSWLGGIDFSDDDVAIQRLIKSAVQWVEVYTGYRLYQREETINCTGTTTYLTITPFQDLTAKDKDGNTVYLYEKWVSPNRLRVVCPADSILTLTAGFGTVADVPGPLIEGCYKIITYWYENRDMYAISIPTDVHMLLNPFRRSLA